MFCVFQSNKPDWRETLKHGGEGEAEGEEAAAESWASLPHL